MALRLILRIEKHVNMINKLGIRNPKRITSNAYSGMNHILVDTHSSMVELNTTCTQVWQVMTYMG